MQPEKYPTDRLPSITIYTAVMTNRDTIAANRDRNLVRHGQENIRNNILFSKLTTEVHVDSFWLIPFIK